MWITYQLVAHLDQPVEVVLEVQVRLAVLGVGLGFDPQPLLGGRTLKTEGNQPSSLGSIEIKVGSSPGSSLQSFPSHGS